MRRLLLMIGLVLMTACESNKEIVSRLSEMEANDIVVFLAGRGIPSDKMAKAGTGGGGETVMEYTISVPEAHYVEAMALLSANGLPRSKTQSLLQIFPAGGMMQDPTERQIRYQAGLAETLAGMIRKFDGVLDAAVVLSIPPAETVPGGTPTRPSASVYVKHQGVLDDPNNQISSKIRRLLSGSIPGLSIDDVVVVSDRSRMAEISLSPSIQPYNAPEEWRSVFGVVVDKDSVGYLQTVLAILLALVILSLASLGWLFWKLSLIVQARGFRSLLSFKPYEAPSVVTEALPSEGIPS
jgi:type III secretion protein J